MLKRFKIGRHERGFLFRGQDYQRLLRPGAHWVWGWGTHLVRHSTRSPALVSEHLDVALRDPQVWDDLVVVDLRPHERALVWADKALLAVLGPDQGRAAFWKDLHEIEVEVHDAEALRFQHRHLELVLAHPQGRQRLVELAVPKGQRGLLYVDEVLREELGPGRYVFWRGVARLDLALVDLREVPLEVAGQEILTRDKVSLRLNLSAAFLVTDPRRAAERVADLRGAIYRELQLALREQVGARTLDALLSAKEEVGQAVREAVAPRAAALGVELGAVGVKDVILPGEMKDLLNQVIEAEKRAQAKLIERREETAATRSLLNTARLIEQSPVLLRLKELEAAERLVQSVDSVHVVGGGLEGLLQQLLPPRRDASA